MRTSCRANGGWYNTGLVLVVFIAVGIVVVARTKWLLKEEPYELRNLLLSVGVKLKRITKTTKEIEVTRQALESETIKRKESTHYFC